MQEEASSRPLSNHAQTFKQEAMDNMNCRRSLGEYSMSFTYRGLKTTSSFLFELSLQRQGFSLEDIKKHTPVKHQPINQYQADSCIQGANHDLLNVYQWSEIFSRRTEGKKPTYSRPSPHLSWLLQGEKYPEHVTCKSWGKLESLSTEGLLSFPSGTVWYFESG